MAKRSLRRWLWGPFSLFGLVLLIVTFVADQAHKWWMLHVYRIEEKGKVEVTSFFDLVMVWNEGISYGLFAQDPSGQWILILFAIMASCGLWIWMALSENAVAGAAMGLIIGGALANAVDRGVYGAVADFFSLHAFGYHWYVFNIADVAIVVGVIGLLYEALFMGHKKVSNTS